MEVNEEGFVEKKTKSAKEADDYQQNKVRKKQDLFWLVDRDSLLRATSKEKGG